MADLPSDRFAQDEATAAALGRAMLDADREPTYTLDEAKRELARRECVRDGHDFDVVVEAGTREPTTFHCSRCAASWTVVADDA